MKLSIIVPVYNVEKYLNRCIDSLLAQNLPSYEILLINDGSTDRSYEIMQTYQAKYPDRIRLFSQPNSGQGAARNLGVQAALGEYITFVDSDDYVEKNCYSSLIALADQHRCDILLFDWFTDYGSRLQAFQSMPQISSPRFLTAEEYLLSSPSPWNKIFRLDIWQKHGLAFPEKIWYEDFALFPQFALYAKRIYYIKQPAYFYFQSDNSTMRHSDFRPKWYDMWKAIALIYQNLYPAFPQETEYLFFSHFLYETSLRFYQVFHTGGLNKIADTMRQYFPRWRKNLYVKKYASRKQKFLCLLFYHKQYRIIRTMQNLKKILRRSK